MLRQLQVMFVLGLTGVALPAAAQDTTDEPKPESPQAAQADKPSETTEGEPAAGNAPAEEAAPKEPLTASVDVKAALPAPAPEVEPVEKPEGWNTFITGYFRAPMALGISTRPGPDNMTGPAETQISYGPTRTFDANYYSFAYTRLQEQDWAEFFVHAKKKHVEAVIGMMGYWYQAAGFRVPDASWFPGMAYLTLDTDVNIGTAHKPNVALTVGSFWPAFGTFAKYDTYTLGRFRQLGEQVKLTIPINEDFTTTLTHGFGTGRDGTFQITVQPPYQATVGLNLMHYENVKVSYKDYVDVGLHYNTQWTQDPNLTQQVGGGKDYAQAKAAKVSTLGAEVNVSVPRAGHLWLSPSMIQVKNGWALNNSGIEVMHSLGGMGLAGNYLAWTNDPPTSTGTGSMFNLGFLYENKLSGILDKPLGSMLPDVTLNVFGLYTGAKLELPAGSQIAQTELKQFKYGADVTLQALTWLGVMARFDEVNYDMDRTGNVFSAITGRLILSSHFLSSESIYLQYSRYRYGEKIVLAGKWPWGTPMVPGSDIVQGSPYTGQTPDMDIFRIQANVAF